MRPGRFLVKAESVNAVRRVLDRAPGGVRVVGRHDRETIECSHTMDERSLARTWPIILSRLSKAGLAVVSAPDAGRDRDHDEPSDDPPPTRKSP